MYFSNQATEKLSTFLTLSFDIPKYKLTCTHSNTQNIHTYVHTNTNCQTRKNKYAHVKIEKCTYVVICK